MALIYDRLTQINDNLEVEPMLAESWEFAKDGSTLEFKLRKDATFADGTKIDAAAVKANLDRARSAPYSTHLNALKSITNVTAVNPRRCASRWFPARACSSRPSSRRTPG